jgi:hypothetical protein
LLFPRNTFLIWQVLFQAEMGVVDVCSVGKMCVVCVLSVY